MHRLRLASALSARPLRALVRRLRPLHDLDPEEAGPAPQQLTAAERAELAAARPFAAVPGPSSWPLVGSLAALVGSDASRLELLFGGLRRRYGDLYRFTHPLRNVEIVVTFRPSDVEKVFRSEGKWPIRPGFYPVRQYNNAHGLNQGLFSSNGRAWSEMRPVVQQYMLRKGSMLRYVPHIESSAERLVDALLADRDPDGSLQHDFLQHAYRATFDVIYKMTHGSGKWADSADLANIVRNARSFFGLLSELEFKTNAWRYWSTTKWNQFTRVMDFYVGMADQWSRVALERNSSDEPTILAALHQQGLSADQLKALAFDFLLGGIDTTGLSLQYLMYRLATNPECQERAYTEIQQEVPPPGQVMTQQYVKNLNYVRACIRESLRLSSPLLGIGRKLGKDVVLGGYRIPKGKVVFMPNYMIARDDPEFVDGGRFVPGRWLRERVCPAATSPFASLPFSHGPRMCVGRRLAEQELLIFTARILQRFRVEYSGPPLDVLTQIVCIPSAVLPFTLVERPPQASGQASDAAAHDPQSFCPTG